MMFSFANASLFDVTVLIPRSMENRRGDRMLLPADRRSRFAEAVGQLAIDPAECTPPVYEDAERWDGLS